MAISGQYTDSFGGWNIIPMPQSPAPKQIDFLAEDSVSVSMSPFTRQAQVMQWPGADFWEINVSLPPMGIAHANQWIAWLLALRGQANVFQIGDPFGAKPQGHPDGLPVADGLHSAMATILHTKSWTPNRGNLLLPGDYIQIGYRLHRVAGVVPIQSDADGKAQIEIWPSLRETVADGQALTLTNTKGLFRLAENTRQWSAMETKLFGIAFHAIEAR